MKNYIFLMCIALISCTEVPLELKILQGNAIGTTYNIQYLASDDQNFELLIDEVIAAINRSTSTYLPNSDISKINNGDTTVVVDAYFEEVFNKSKIIFNETNGDFDPTIGILVNAWGFGPGDAIEHLDSIKIKQLLKYVGFDKVHIQNGKVNKMYPEIYIDFNAIAKGYLVDLVGRLFEKNDISNYLVEIGGEIRVRGVNLNGEYWKIGLDNPNKDGIQTYSATTQLRNESIATSGNYRKFRTTKDGKKIVHTINTKTGYATESNLLSAAVISKSDCAEVDAYATAFMAMGFEKAKKFLDTHKELKAYLIYINEKGEMETYKSANLMINVLSETQSY